MTMGSRQANVIPNRVRNRARLTCVRRIDSLADIFGPVVNHSFCVAKFRHFSLEYLFAASHYSTAAAPEDGGGQLLAGHGIDNLSLGGNSAQTGPRDPCVNRQIQGRDAGIHFGYTHTKGRHARPGPGHDLIAIVLALT